MGRITFLPSADDSRPTGRVLVVRLPKFGAVRVRVRVRVWVRVRVIDQ